MISRQRGGCAGITLVPVVNFFHLRSLAQACDYFSLYHIFAIRIESDAPKMRILSLDSRLPGVRELHHFQGPGHQLVMQPNT